MVSEVIYVTTLRMLRCQNNTVGISSAAIPKTMKRVLSEAFDE
jgi:cytochrome c-type biogenesis protein CcmH/NrfF